MQNFQLAQNDEQAVLDIASSPADFVPMAVAAARDYRTEVLRQLKVLGYGFDNVLVELAKAGDVRGVKLMLAESYVKDEDARKQAFEAAAGANQVEVLRTMRPVMTRDALDLWGAGQRAGKSGANDAMAYIVSEVARDWVAHGKSTDRKYYNAILRSFEAAIAAGHKDTAAIALRVLDGSGIRKPESKPEVIYSYGHSVLDIL